jgi:hypothetical protein
MQSPRQLEVPSNQTNTESLIGVHGKSLQSGSRRHRPSELIVGSRVRTANDPVRQDKQYKQTES